ncbi:MAG: hypothetical protein B6U78_02155 [Candidatus Aenigmarchaeota archaeon ex4484_224]|nr:MAG: hypothetical protein B6U78_02155 [Candidatus Aenigmarchaeota archaeon ex4484_224]
MLSLTTFIFSYSLSTFLKKRNIFWLAIGSLFPSIDFSLSFLGIIHRQNPFHSLTLLFLLSVFLYSLTKRKEIVHSFSLGYSVHLFLDLLSFEPIPLFYPLSFGYSLNLFYSSSFLPNFLLILVSGIIILRKDFLKLIRIRQS